MRFLDLEGSWGKGSEMLVQRLGAVLDDEEKVAGEAYLFYSRGRRRYVSLDGEGVDLGGCWSPGSSPGMIAREH